MYASQVNNDNIHQGLKGVFSDKNIHSLSSLVSEKVGDPLNICFILQSNSYDNIPKCNMGCYTFTHARALKQMGT